MCSKKVVSFVLDYLFYLCFVQNIEFSEATEIQEISPQMFQKLNNTLKWHGKFQKWWQNSCANRQEIYMKEFSTYPLRRLGDFNRRKLWKIVGGRWRKRNIL